MKTKLYSYQRWSSAVQKDGSTQERQSTGAAKYAEENDYELVEIVDDGVSAFTGVNATKGALSAFIRAVEDGFIASNSTLYVESLDRISRQKVLKAVGLFNDLLELGITIVTGSDRKVYTEESVNENSMDLLQSILLFTRAHEESKTKQLRTNASALILVNRHKQGLPVTIKSVGSHPWWIDASTDKHEAVRRHPVLWPIARIAIDLFLEGKSVFHVTGLLNDEYPKAWKGKTWNYANVRKLRTNKAVYGTRNITIAGQDIVLENYYPALITEGEFLRLESIKETNKYLGKVGVRTNNINLLAGMKKFRCGHCGSTMMAMRHKDTIRYLCEKGRMGSNECKVWSIPGQLVEHCLMLVVTIAYINITRNGHAEKEDYTSKIKDTEESIKDISTRISNLTTLIASGLGNVNEVVSKIRELDETRKKLTFELDVLSRKQILAQDNTFESLMMDFFNYAQWGVLQDVLHEYRHKLRDIVLSSIGEVVAWKVDRKISLSFQIKGNEEHYTFSAGTEPYDFVFGYTGQHNYMPDSEVLKSLAREINESSMMVLQQAHNLLEVVGYPKLDGRMFWPRK